MNVVTQKLIECTNSNWVRESSLWVKLNQLH